MTKSSVKAQSSASIPSSGLRAHRAPFYSAHTPTPWRVLGDSTRIVADLETGETLVICDGTDTTSTLFSDLAIKRGRADVALIVKAVNQHDALVNTLRAAVHAMQSYQYGNASSALADEIVEAARPFLEPASGLPGASLDSDSSTVPSQPSPKSEGSDD